MSGRIPLIDRLRDRGFVDQWGFMVFAVLGFAGIISAKWFEAETVWVAAGAVLAMFAYAIVIGRSGTGRIRADQAGDNCYYLGLIYTLASLSFAIGTFDPGDTASTIVQGFGIALATTIFGLILRVFFNQGRPDLENVEEQARLELTEAAARLKGELNGVVRTMNDFSRQLQQSMQEMHDSAKASVDDFTSNSVEGLKSVVETANGTIRGQANDFATRSKRYSTTFDGLLDKLEQHGASVERMTETHDALGKTADAAKLTAESANISVQALSKSTEAAQATASSAEEASRSAKILVEQLASSVSALEAGLKSIREETDRQLESLKLGPAETVSIAMANLTKASLALETHIAEVSSLHDDVRANLVVQSEAALAATQKHNDGLEAELGRSRELVERVHASLAEMTEALAKTVEGAA
jgi:chromosome segregation ATPase